MIVFSFSFIIRFCRYQLIKMEIFLTQKILWRVVSITDPVMNLITYGNLTFVLKFYFFQWNCFYMLFPIHSKSIQLSFCLLKDISSNYVLDFFGFVLSSFSPFQNLFGYDLTLVLLVTYQLFPKLFWATKHILFTFYTRCFCNYKRTFAYIFFSV